MTAPFGSVHDGAMSQGETDSGGRLRDVVRGLLLPVDPENEDVVLQAVGDAMVAAGVTRPDEHGPTLRLDVDDWRERGSVSSRLETACRWAIEAGDELYGQRIAKGYFALHSELQQTHLLSFDAASAFLSHARLAAHLAEREMSSSAQVSRVLTARDRRASFSWQSVQLLLRKLQIAPALSMEEVVALHAWDGDLDKTLLADADVDDATEIVGALAEDLGFGDGITKHLKALASNDAVAHGPYLQMLHYQCVIAEFFDHALTMIYEFSPRGEVAEWIFDRYPAGLVGARNPFLNNAKSVDRLDEAWARSKDRQGLMAPAYALVELLQGLEDMGFQARRELAGWLRRWLLRVIRVREPLATIIPTSLSAQQLRAVFEAVSDGETLSLGVLEQRLVDLAAVVAHPEAAGWRLRGIGDPVNATNLSRLKLGDVDCQLPDDRRVVAYEAHAGDLSQVYIEAHLHTLRRVLPARQREWLGIADLSEWNLEIIFVAHSATAAEGVYGVQDFPVTVRLVSFRDLLAVIPVDVRLALVAELVVSPINARRSPQLVRDRFAELASIVV